MIFRHNLYLDEWKVKVVEETDTVTQGGVHAEEHVVEGAQRRDILVTLFQKLARTVNILKQEQQEQQEQCYIEGS